MRHTQLINYALYQIGWFACVLGGASHRPWTGFLIAMILSGLHLALSAKGLSKSGLWSSPLALEWSSR